MVLGLSVLLSMDITILTKDMPDKKLKEIQIHLTTNNKKQLIENHSVYFTLPLPETKKQMQEIGDIFDVDATPLFYDGEKYISVMKLDITNGTLFRKIWLSNTEGQWKIDKIKPIQAENSLIIKEE